PLESSATQITLKLCFLLYSVMPRMQFPTEDRFTSVAMSKPTALLKSMWTTTAPELPTYSGRGSLSLSSPPSLPEKAQDSGLPSHRTLLKNTMAPFSFRTERKEGCG